MLLSKSVRFGQVTLSRGSSGLINMITVGKLTQVQLVKLSIWTKATVAPLPNRTFNCGCVRVISSRDVTTPENKDIDPLIDPDVGDFIEDDTRDHRRGTKDDPKRSSSSKVKVKFNWKNSLVTTDSLKLLANLYEGHPQLIDFDEDKLVEFLQIMSIYSIDVEKAAKMVIMNPKLIHHPESAIVKTIGTLRACGLSESQRSHILGSRPEIFNYPSKLIEKQFSFLTTYLSKEESVSAICKSVECLLESESSLKKKLEYLIKEMSHETKSICNCKALSYPLEHIKTRHEFLIRSGLFKPIPYRKLIKTLEKEYKDKSKPRFKYFKPIEVVCYKDEDYLETCTKGVLSLNELVAFEELYAAELQVLEEEEGELEEEMTKELQGRAHEEEEDEDFERDNAVSLVKAPNSVGFFNELEANSCYF